MAIRKDRTFLRQLHTLFNLGAIRDLTDGQLLERFASGGGEGGELAFAALVERHAALVLRVCRAQLGNPHDAQDAFQATFLILVKKARTLWVRDSIGPWLHQVAFRTAVCARTSIARRKRLEQRAAGLEAYEAPNDNGWEQVLHEELNRLPERYRVPIVLCDLQGHSCEEAARRMGRPVGTVKSWRSRGRDRIRHRLIRLGLAPAGVLAANIARAGMPGTKPDDAVARAMRVLSDQMTTGMVPASVLRLANGVLKAMILSKARTTVAALLAFVVLGSCLGTIARVGAQDSPESRGETQGKPASTVKDRDKIWPLSLPEAIRIGLGNCETIRVVKPATSDTLDGNFVIASQQTNVDAYRFKSELLAYVRSVEQQYWALSLKNVEYSAAETAVALTEQIVKREQAKLSIGQGSVPAMAEAKEQLERFRMDFVDKTANLITTERQLRNTLGLSAIDGRRIVPATPALEAHVEPNWEECQRVMLNKQPDLLRAKARLGDSAAAESFKGYTLVLNQTSQALARFVIEVDSNYKLFKTAGQLKDAAKQRMSAQAVFYEDGKITIDRYLDAVNRWATSVAQEADFKMRYNSAIAALEETKGSLLDSKHITVVEGPKPDPSAVAPRDGAAKPVSLPTPAPSPVVTGDKAEKPVALGLRPSPLPAARNAVGTTYSFQFSIGTGPKPVEIRGSFTVAPALPALPAEEPRAY